MESSVAEPGALTAACSRVCQETVQVVYFSPLVSTAFFRFSCDHLDQHSIQDREGVRGARGATLPMITCILLKSNDGTGNDLTLPLIVCEACGEESNMWRTADVGIGGTNFEVYHSHVSCTYARIQATVQVHMLTHMHNNHIHTSVVLNTPWAAVSPRLANGILAGFWVSGNPCATCLESLSFFQSRRIRIPVPSHFLF